MAKAIENQSSPGIPIKLENENDRSPDRTVAEETTGRCNSWLTGMSAVFCKGLNAQSSLPC